MAKRKEEKKTADSLYERCQTSIDRCGTRDSDLDALDEYYFQEGEHSATGETAEGIERVRLPYATNAVDLAQDLLGQAKMTVTVPALGEGTTQKKLADAAEKYLKAVLDQSARYQKQDLLSRAAWLVSMRGQLAARVLALPQWLEKEEAEEGETKYSTGPRLPLLVQLRDPRYVYPEFGVDGLSYIVERRTRKVLDLREMLCDPKLLEGQDEDDDVEWTEYWDRKTYCYWADGAVIKLAGSKEGPWPHLYGGLPYTFEFARQTGRLEPEKRARPLLQAAKGVIDRMDLQDSAEATFIAQYNGDALVVYSDDDSFKMDARPGAVNYMRPNERVEWMRAGRQPIEVQAAHTKYSAQFDRATFPGSMYGVDPGRVMSGFAITQLNQSGQARLAPLAACIERTLAGVMESVLMISENFLQPLIGGPIEFYTFGLVQNPETGDKYKARVQSKLDASKFGGFYSVEVSLSDLLPADEQANVVMASRVRAAGSDGRPLLSWETAVDRWKLTGSPSEERDRIDREAAWNDPEVALLRRTLFVAEVKAELGKELADLGVDVDQVLAQAQAQGQEGGPEAPTPGAGAPPGPAAMPPSVMPAQMQGMMEPQPMGAMPPMEGEMPFGQPPGPPVPMGV